MFVVMMEGEEYHFRHRNILNHYLYRKIAKRFVFHYILRYPFQGVRIEEVHFRKLKFFFFKGVGIVVLILYSSQAN